MHSLEGWHAEIWGETPSSLPSSHVLAREHSKMGCCTAVRQQGRTVMHNTFLASGELSA